MTTKKNYIHTCEAANEGRISSHGMFADFTVISEPKPATKQPCSEGKSCVSYRLMYAHLCSLFEFPPGHITLMGEQ